jgi:hypothetical protein
VWLNHKALEAVVVTVVSVKERRSGRSSIRITRNGRSKVISLTRLAPAGTVDQLAALTATEPHAARCGRCGEPCGEC